MGWNCVTLVSCVVMVTTFLAHPHHSTSAARQGQGQGPLHRERRSTATGAACDPGYPVPERPFYVVWDHPDPCELSHRVPMNFSDYSITANSGRRFMGDQVKVYYHSGKWPVYRNGQPVNGGLPQRMDPSHFEHARADFHRYYTPNFTGLGVIDFEAWRPKFRTNFDSLKIYQEESVRLVRQEHPDYNQTMAANTAVHEFESAARLMYQQTLKIAQDMMPGGHWGYYFNPRMWGNEQNTIKVNDLTAWLWRQSTGLYPSVYLKRPSDTVSHMTTFVTSTLKEAARIQAAFSPPGTPIYPFSVIQNSSFYFYPERMLNVALGVPADMGMSGVIVWGSSALYRQPGQCQRLQRYVRDTLGPYVRNLTHVMQQCSQQLCGGHGRCVRRDYDFLHADSTTTSTRTNATCAAPGSRFHDYNCRCYPAWGGTCCERRVLLPCQPARHGTDTELIG